jgi:hypothetical protein
VKCIALRERLVRSSPPVHVHIWMKRGVVYYALNPFPSRLSG